jgi:hypothetical protein
VKQISKRLSYANVMSSLAVFLVLGGATAFAAGLAKNSVGPKQLKKNAVTTAKIKNNAVTTSKIKDGAVTGAKVNAGSLGTVPKATHADNANTVGGLSPDKFSAAGSGFDEGGCDPNSTTFKVCTSVTLNLPHSGPVVLVGAGGQQSFAGIGQGVCEFSVDGVLSDVPKVRPGESASENTQSSAQNGFALTSVTATLGAGSHTFDVQCNETGGDTEFYDVSISAHLVG